MSEKKEVRTEELSDIEATLVLIMTERAIEEISQVMRETKSILDLVVLGARLGDLQSIKDKFSPK